MTPHAVLREVFDNKGLITSIRRAMSVLEDKGLLTKQEDRIVVERYGVSNCTWRLSSKNSTIVLEAV